MVGVLVPSQDLKFACESTRGEFYNLHEWYVMAYRGCNSDVLDRFMVMFDKLPRVDCDRAFPLTLPALHISHVLGVAMGSVSWYTCLFALSI